MELRHCRLAIPKLGSRGVGILLLLVGLGRFLVANAALLGGFDYDDRGVSIAITRYTGGGGAVTIPNTILGKPVTSIGNDAFYSQGRLTSVTIPNSVTSIDNFAFAGCTGLTSVYFAGNPPTVEDVLFTDANNVTVYYRAGASGWGLAFGGRPTVLWNPAALTTDASFGVRTNQFGFTITGPSGITLVVKAATELTHPVWSRIGTKTLTGGSSYFSDSNWADHPSRFYRLRSP